MGGRGPVVPDGVQDVHGSEGSAGRVFGLELAAPAPDSMYRPHEDGPVVLTDTTS